MGVVQRGLGGRRQLLQAVVQQKLTQHFKAIIIDINNKLKKIRSVEVVSVLQVGLLESKSGELESEQKFPHVSLAN